MRPMAMPAVGRLTGTPASISASEVPHTVAIERSEEHTSELQSLRHLVCRLRLEKKKNKYAARTGGRGLARGTGAGPAPQRGAGTAVTPGIRRRRSPEEWEEHTGQRSGHSHGHSQ